MTFSIIIPCYNTALWLEECLRSIKRQNYEDWEIILVNDGSTDNTLNIMRMYAENDDRIKIIDQKNQGVSAARNRAIKEAKGDYLLFLDSDDCYRDKYCLEQIVESLNNGDIDIVAFRYQNMPNKNNIQDKKYLQYFKNMTSYIYTGEEYLQAVLSAQEVYQWFPWLYVFRREFWVRNKFQYDINLWILEDKDIIYRVILKAQRVKVLDNVIYQYRIREGSAAHLRSKRSMEAQLSVCINNINNVNKLKINENLRKLLNDNFSYTYFSIMTEVDFLKKSDRKEIFAFLTKNSNLMNYCIKGKNMFIKRSVQILGFHVTARLLFIRNKCKSIMSYRKI